MRTSRRGFFAAIAAAVAGASLDPERLLWVPGRKLISIPKPRFLTPAEVTNDMLQVLQNQMVLGHGHWSCFEQEYKIGDTITVRRPMRFRA